MSWRCPRRWPLQSPSQTWERAAQRTAGPLVCCVTALDWSNWQATSSLSRWLANTTNAHRLRWSGVTPQLRVSMPTACASFKALLTHALGVLRQRPACVRGRLRLAIATLPTLRSVDSVPVRCHPLPRRLLCQRLCRLRQLAETVVVAARVAASRLLRRARSSRVDCQRFLRELSAASCLLGSQCRGCMGRSTVQSQSLWCRWLCGRRLRQLTTG